MKRIKVFNGVKYAVGTEPCANCGKLIKYTLRGDMAVGAGLFGAGLLCLKCLPPNARHPYVVRVVL